MAQLYPFSYEVEDVVMAKLDLIAYRQLVDAGGAAGLAVKLRLPVSVLKAGVSSSAFLRLRAQAECRASQSGFVVKVLQARSLKA